MATVLDIIQGALELISAVDPEETPASADTETARKVLNRFLGILASENLTIYQVSKETFSLVASKRTYTWGESGDTLTTDRPIELVRAFIRDSNNIDHKVTVRDEKWYMELTSKFVDSRPTDVFFDPGYADATLYMYPVPAEVETFHAHVLKPFTTYTSTSTPIDLPEMYQEFLESNLAVRLAPRFGKTVSAEVLALATTSRNKVKSMNLSRRITSPKLDVAKLSYDRGANYQIDGDSYR